MLTRKFQKEANSARKIEWCIACLFWHAGTICSYYFMLKKNRAPVLPPHVPERPYNKHIPPPEPQALKLRDPELKHR